ITGFACICRPFWDGLPPAGRSAEHSKQIAHFPVLRNCAWESTKRGIMYAVIRAGGKQYRVAPGDVIKIEKLADAADGANVQFNDVLAISGAEGELGKAANAFVTGEVLEQGRADKILVFH